MSEHKFDLRKRINNNGHVITRGNAIKNMQKVEKAMQNKRKRVEIAYEPFVNRCTRCRTDMGPMNPRQLCGKTYCMNKLSDSEAESDKDSETESDSEAESAADSKIDLEEKSNSSPPVEKSVEPQPIESIEPIEIDGRKPIEIELLADAAYETAQEIEPTTFNISEVGEVEEPIESTKTESKTESVDTESVRIKPAKIAKSSKKGSNESSDGNESKENESNENESNESDDEWIPDKDDWAKIKKTTSFADLIAGTAEEDVEKMYDPKKYGITDKKEIALLKKIKKLNDEKEPTVQKIINSKWHFEKKAWLMERYFCMTTTDKLGQEYFEQRDQLNRILDDINVITDEDIERYGAEKKWIETQATYHRPTIKDVMESKLKRDEKLQMFNKIIAIRETQVDQYKSEQLIKEELRKHQDSDEYNNMKRALAERESKLSVKNRIANLTMDESTKIHILREYEAFLELTGTDDEIKYKLEKWVNITLNLPTIPKVYDINVNDPVKIREFSKERAELINQKIYGLPDFKDYIKDFVLQCVTKPDTKGNILALCGPPGTGKSTIGTCIAQCLDREFIYISMGGMNSAVALIGSARVFSASHPGHLISKFSGLKYNNPVLFIDEIDKAGGTNPKESIGIQGALTHILDPEHNNKFVDEFMGFPIDLSKCIIIVSYNDESLLEKQVVDRFNTIYIKEYSLTEKIDIAKGYLLPDIYKNLGINSDLVKFSKKIIQKIICMSKSKEKGVRQLKRNLRRIVQCLNSAWLVRSAPFTMEMTEFPFTEITSELVDCWFYESKNEDVTASFSMYS